jgi:hypothetical protein
LTAKGRGAFRSLGSRKLAALGIEGDEIAVRLEGDQLVLTGSESGTLAIPASAVDRMRHFGTEEVQELPGNIPATMEVKIWWGGRPEPVLLTPFANHKAYGAVIGGFAERVVAWRGVERLMLGPGYATAIINLLIVGPPCLLLFALLLGLSIWESAWWWLATIPLAALFLWLGGRNIVSRWPRRVRSLEAFKTYLP